MILSLGAFLDQHPDLWVQSPENPARWYPNEIARTRFLKPYLDRDILVTQERDREVGTLWIEERAIGWRWTIQRDASGANPARIPRLHLWPYPPTDESGSQ